MFQYHKGLYGADVGNGNSVCSSLLGYEEFICALLSEMKQGGSFRRVYAEFSMALNKDTAISRAVFNGYSLSRINGQLFCGDVRIRVGDPLLYILVCLGLYDGFTEVVFLIMRIHILLPVKKFEYVFHVLPVFRKFLVQHLRRINLAGYDVLIYGVYVRVPLRLIGQNRRRCMD